MSNLPAETLAQRTRCEVWTRVMGYHRPVSQFNTGKKAEHCSRKPFTETVSANHRFVERYGVQAERAVATV